MSRFRAPFSRLGAGQVDAILQTISRNERTPQTPLETFFVMAKQATVYAYYTSNIGIHQELRYKGNVFIKEFVGCQTVDGKERCSPMSVEQKSCTSEVAAIIELT